MSAPPLANTFAGGSDGVAITAGNSGGGSGNAFNAVAGTDWLFESSDGVPSAQAVNPLDSSYLEWQALGTITGAVYTRFYVNLPSTPTTNHWVAGCFVNAALSSVFAPFVFATDGKLYDGGTVSGLTFATGTWFRVESRVVPSTSGAGESEYRYYADPLLDVNSWTTRTQRTGLTMGIANIDRWRFLGGAGAANSTVSPRVKNVAISTVDFIGPTPPPPTLRTVVQSGLRLART